MATTLPETRPESSVQPEPPENEEHSPEVIHLEDRLPEWFRCTPGAPVIAVVLAIVFVFLNSIPLAHTDLWGHLNYGRLIWNARSIPATEPTMSLASGIQMVDTAWLSQVIGFAAVTAFGTAGLKFLFAASITLVAGLVAHIVRRRTGGVIWPTISIISMLVVGWMQLSIIRPQLAGFACFGILLHWTLTRRTHKSDWFTVPLLFIAWANLHGSFMVGLLVLTAATAGELIDHFRHSQRISLAFRSRAFIRSLLLLELAAVACLVNPYGLEIYRTVLTFSENANLTNLVDWDPLTLRMVQGRAAAVLAFALLVVLRATPRRIRATEFLLLAGLGILALWTSRMLLWWVPVAACTLGIHGHAAWLKSGLYRRLTGRTRSQLHDRRWNSEEPVARSLWTVTMFGIAFLGFSMTPLSMKVRNGQEQEFSQAVSRSTPVAAAAFLNEMQDRPAGVVMNTYEWGDYLQWSCPNLDVIANSHVHLIPEEIWDHYIDIHNGVGVINHLERYGVNLVVLRINDSPALIKQIREDTADWNEVYTDDMAAIFIRRNPI